MNKEAFKKEIAKLQVAYNKRFTQEEKGLWFKEFMTVDTKEFEKAVNKTIKEIPYIPKIADIRARITANSNDPYAYLYKNLEWCETIKGERNDD
jgi:hypothetical protein